MLVESERERGARDDEELGLIERLNYKSCDDTSMTLLLVGGSLPMAPSPLPGTHSGPATFLPSTSPVPGSLISSQLLASNVAPVLLDTANNTPSELLAVERK